MHKVKVVNKSKNPLPSYATVLSAGMDIHANIETRIWIDKNCRKLIPTGLFIELPEGFEAQIRPRSGLALKKGVTVLNSPGTIDADYRGEIGVILINHSEECFFIEPNDKICQMVIARFEKVEWDLVEDLSNTERGEGGFGHTGK